jgi:L-ascorbate metabolism protein UlaG (beta-lactamase superfamily)
VALLCDISNKIITSTSVCFLVAVNNCLYHSGDTAYAIYGVKTVGYNRVVVVFSTS